MSNQFYNKYKDKTRQEIEEMHGKGGWHVISICGPGGTQREESDGSWRNVCGARGGIISTNDWLTPKEVVAVSMHSPLSTSELEIKMQWDMCLMMLEKDWED